MANRNFTQYSYGFLKAPVHIVGSVELSAAAAVSSFKIPGVASVAKTGTGSYTLTLEDKYTAAYSVMAQLAGTAEDLQAVVMSEDVDGAKTIVIATKTAGVSTDATAAAKLYVHLVLSNSSLNA